MNLRFDYLYRDAGNWKKHGSIIFSNPNNLTPENVLSILSNQLGGDLLFMAHQVRIPEIFLFSNENEVTADDQCFHEVSGVVEARDKANDPYHRTIDELLAEVREAIAKGRWEAFDTSDRLQCQEQFLRD